MESISVGFLSVVPPIVAIALALITKEVVFSLLLGIFSGAAIYSFAAGLGVAGIFTTTTDLMITKISDGGNASMIIFLALLGALVNLVTKAGGSKAYGTWAAAKIKGQRSAGLVTVLLGILIFIDDYFNCLTVGTVMRPVTDRHKISREKLAYIIDATAAPICVIAPISSWAASVISYYPADTGISGMQAFISAIPMNLYAILTLFMVIYLSVFPKADYGPMRKMRLAEPSDAVKKDSWAGVDDYEVETSGKGTVLDLIIPVVFLVIFSILAMLWYGGLWAEPGKTLFAAFGDTTAGYALALGAFCALLLTFFLFVPRKLLSFKDFFKGITEGIKFMVGAIVILTLAWTISGICRDLLQTGLYVAGLVQTASLPVAFIPAIMFITAAALSFATGTSWGTFGILIPITLNICEVVAPELSVIALSSVLAGSVFGDHCSPISDTTILSSTGAGCSHINHVATQIPYALTVAAVCFAGYIIAGFAAPLGFGMSVIITLPASLVLLLIILLGVPREKQA